MVFYRKFSRLYCITESSKKKSSVISIPSHVTGHIRVMFVINPKLHGSNSGSDTQVLVNLRLTHKTNCMGDSQKI